ncbi:hypothetical protein B0H21DRAFT_733182 [Amylocystis lapponica]|nr:hypothetical protein B0H21DRAFT_733182 [Amylocystis lapponica]
MLDLTSSSTCRARRTVLLGFLVFSFATLAASSSCSSFALQNLTDVTLTGAIYYAANAIVNLSNGYQTINADHLPAFCRVQLMIVTNTTAKSYCNTEVWLPDDWNGRFLTFGNGGFAGGVAVADLGYIAVAQGCPFHPVVTISCIDPH